jgi:hypothetical protein
VKNHGMIIIGTIELSFTKGSGTFFCTKCGAERAYKHKTKRQFLTVYFIPLIPLQAAGEFIQCSTCREQFDPSATRLTAAEHEAARRDEAVETIRRVMVVIVAADEVVSDEELLTVQQFADQHELPDITKELVLTEAARIRQAGLDAVGYIQGVARQLSMEDKERLVHHAFLVATVGGELSEARQKLLRQLPDAVGIPESRFREIIVEAAEQ